jgi:hypothetical protein
VLEKGIEMKKGEKAKEFGEGTKGGRMQDKNIYG